MYERIDAAFIFQGPLIELMPDYVRVLLQSTFREAAKRKELLKEARPGLTLKSLLNELAKEYGEEFENILEPNANEVGPDVLIMVNGIAVRKANVQLRDGDVVIITTPIGGG